MQFNRFFLVCFSGLLGSWFGSSSNCCWAGTIDRLVVIGDSASDAGNVFDLSAGALPPWPSYYQGRWTNGPVWVDYLAEKLQVPVPAASRQGGTNYAYSGAETGNEWTDESINFAVPGMGLQVQDFLEVDAPTASDLFVIYGGYNDLGSGAQSDAHIPANNVLSLTRTLYDAGGRNFLLPNLFPGSETQESNLRQVFNSSLARGIRQLRTDLPDAEFHTFDFYGFLFDLYNDRANNGIQFSGHALEMTNGDVAENPNRILCWDDPWCHLNTDVHRLMADAVFEQEFAAMVPEPAGVTLAFTMGFALSCLRYRRIHSGQ